jgi:hypothetical protein
MNAPGFIDEQWKEDLVCGLEAAVDAIRRQEPRATDEIIESMVREMAQSAITSWRHEGASAEGPRNEQWETATHESLEERVAAVRHLSPETDEVAAVALVRQGAQATLDAWQLHT